jgi:hypothetical protein
VLSLFCQKVGFSHSKTIIFNKQHHLNEPCYYIGSSMMSKIKSDSFKIYIVEPNIYKTYEVTRTKTKQKNIIAKTFFFFELNYSWNTRIFIR